MAVAAAECGRATVARRLPEKARERGVNYRELGEERCSGGF